MKGSTKKLMVVIGTCGFLFACGGGMEKQGLSKSEARAIGKADWWTDFCEEYGWYGDSECDEFCPQPDPDCQAQATEHRPLCRNQGSKSEGWYWGDTNELIKWDACASKGEAQCGAIGTRSEGWFSEPGGLIAFDNQCHKSLRISLYGEACGGSIGFSCHTGLYCQGMPADRIGGTGSCRNMGYCEAASDCDLTENEWDRPRCPGYATCDNNSCGWVCSQEPQGVWSWTSFLFNGAESDHPYPDNYNHQWVVLREGASQIKLHFSRIDIEHGYDWLQLEGGDQSMALDGQVEDFWTEPFSSDRVTLTLESDYSINGYGFRVDAIAIYEQLSDGLCNSDADCRAGEQCVPHQCFNAYAPCYGDCRPAGEQTGNLSFDATDTPLEIPDNRPAGIESRLQVAGLPACELDVAVSVDISHSYIGDLTLKLVSPDGAELALHDRQGGSQRDLHIAAQSLDGQLDAQNGTWLLKVADHAALDDGSLNSWSLEFSCR